VKGRRGDPGRPGVKGGIGESAPVGRPGPKGNRGLPGDVNTLAIVEMIVTFVIIPVEQLATKNYYKQ